MFRKTKNNTNEKSDYDIEEHLNTNIKEGLSTKEYEERINKFGKNEIKEHKQNQLLKFLSYFIDPIAILIVIAFILSIIVKDYINFVVIGILLVLNAFIGWSMEAHAESAIESLKSNLSIKSTCLRDGKIIKINSDQLVPGDIISVRIGDIVPADCKLLGININGDITESIQIDQSSITGESLPINKGKDENIFSSSIVKKGQMMAMVIKTGSNTFIGRTVNLISKTNEKGHFQITIAKIGRFLLLITILMVIVLFIFLMIKNAGKNVLTIIDNIVVLAVASIPVGLPTVLSVTMAVGAKQLSKKSVIIKRLPSIEELASVSIICCDKTGTLTKNELVLDKFYLVNNHTEKYLLLYSYLASEKDTNDPIELMIRNSVKEKLDLKTEYLGEFKVIKFEPFDPESKKTISTVLNISNNKEFKITKGAPFIIFKLCKFEGGLEIVKEFASRGLRVLAVAVSNNNNENWELVGLLSFFDPPRDDSSRTIEELSDNGIKLKMITGDQRLIAKEVAFRMKMNRVIVDASIFDNNEISEDRLIQVCEKADGFAHSTPEHKFKIVELLQERNYLVAMTGDGVNDAPALKKADVGIAVHGCTDAARSAADIVLLSPGLSTITNSIKISRSIFQRLRSFSLYRITSTVHILIFFFFIILIEQWKMNPSLLILIAILNDLSTIIIAFDNVQISKKPDKWRIGQLITTSFILGTLLSLFSFGNFYIAKCVFVVNDNQMQTIMYLNISTCPHFMIFSTRLSDYFYKNIPSLLFISIIMSVHIFAILISIFGIKGFIYPIGYKWGLSIILISILYFIFLDIIKVQILKYWSFKLTAYLFPTESRKQKLNALKLDEIKRKRLSNNIMKIKNIDNIVRILNIYQNK